MVAVTILSAVLAMTAAAPASAEPLGSFGKEIVASSDGRVSFDRTNSPFPVPVVGTGQAAGRPPASTEFAADVQRPAEQYRGRYQTKLGAAPG